MSLAPMCQVVTPADSTKLLKSHIFCRVQQLETILSVQNNNWKQKDCLAPRHHKLGSNNVWARLQLIYYFYFPAAALAVDVNP